MTRGGLLRVRSLRDTTEDFILLVELGNLRTLADYHTLQYHDITSRSVLRKTKFIVGRLNNHPPKNPFQARVGICGLPGMHTCPHVFSNQLGLHQQP
jgi:hypothetical protein